MVIELAMVLVLMSYYLRSFSSRRIRDSKPLVPASSFSTLLISLMKYSAFSIRPLHDLIASLYDSRKFDN